MLFNSLTFLYGFLPVTYLIFWLLRTKNQRYVWLAITGYIFYSFWNYQFCALMLFSTLVSYLAGLALLRFSDPLARKLCLIAPIAVDLLLLAFFKYANFTLESLQGLAHAFHQPISVPHLDVILPVGISFYTFHTITYMVDSYKRQITPTKNFFEFACYVSLFSQLVAGPIVRFRQIEQDLESIQRADRMQRWERAVSFFAIGMIEKVLIADNIAAIINPGFENFRQLSSVGAWLCALGYTYQLYFDFVGYSDMAVGLGYMFGLQIPQNFDSPYKALDISDFWRRWHISLSSCLRDYLYIPLGGNRGSSRDTFRNMMITMLIGGLWHGASWTFVFWGAYHGALLGFYRLFKQSWDALPAVPRRLATFLLVMIGWVFFRSTSFKMAGVILAKMFIPTSGVVMPALAGLLALLSLAAWLAQYAPNTWELRHHWRPAPALVLSALFAVCMLVMYAGKESPFLYFQF